MNRITTFALTGALAASMATWGCNNDKDHDASAKKNGNPVTDTVGGAAKTTGNVAGGAAKTTGDVAGDAAKTTGDVAGGAAKTTGDVAGGAAKTTGDVVGGAAKTTGDVVGGAAKTTGDAAAGAVGTAVDTEKGGAKWALASITASKAPGNDDVSGIIRFEQTAKGLHVWGDIMGMEPDSEHGFHVHEKADLSAPDLKSAGGHFNPTKTKHGGPTGDMRHGGDLGNLKADDKGTASYDAVIPGLTIDGSNGVVGHSLIIHAKADDLKTDPSGNSGDRIAGGVIEAAPDAKALPKAGAHKAPAGEKDASNDAKEQPAK